jgi:hypothetical protein
MEPFDFNAKVLGRTLSTSISNLPSFAQKNMLNILEQGGIKNLDADIWYSFKTVLAIYQKIAKDFGPNTMFDFGKSIPEKAVFPPEIDSIDKAFHLINTAYNMNHKDGYVGFYKIFSHDLEEKKIVMQCYNPYPCDLDRGLFTAMARKFQSGVRVVIDESKPNKKTGGNETWYIISYR